MNHSHNHGEDEYVSEDEMVDDETSFDDSVIEGRYNKSYRQTNTQ
jgi:hypothetical protein